MRYPSAAFPGNKFWLDYYGGDFSAVNQANMLLSITFNGSQGCTLMDTFTAVRHGGGWSKF